MDEHRNYPPHVSKLVALIHRMIQEMSRDIFLVLDGLDELGSTPRGRVERELLLQFVRELIASGYGNLHLLLSSKPEDDIKLATKPTTDNVTAMDVSAGLRIDVADFVVYNMEHTPSLKGISNDILWSIVTENRGWEIGISKSE